MLTSLIIFLREKIFLRFNVFSARFLCAKRRKAKFLTVIPCSQGLERLQSSHGPPQNSSWLEQLRPPEKALFQHFKADLLNQGKRALQQLQQSATLLPLLPHNKHNKSHNKRTFAAWFPPGVMHSCIHFGVWVSYNLSAN